MLVAAALPGAGFAGAALVVLARLLAPRATRLPAAIAMTTAATCAALAGWLLALDPGTVWWRANWIGAAQVGAGVHVDGLARLFAVVVAAMAALACAYSLRFIAHEREVRGLSTGDAAYYVYLLLFTGAMLGLVLAEDLVQLYVFWELTDIASFLLIALHWQSARARGAAVRALVVTAVGGLAALLGFVLLATAAGTSSIPALLDRGLPPSASVEAAAVLLVIGAATKSAQVPFHGWLPRAMVAPIPVNAFLDSAALLAAGVYLLARLSPLLASTASWAWTLTALGLASMVAAAVLAARERDLKQILAYSTISLHGFMFTLLGAGTDIALAAALFFLVQHAVVKSGLFLAVGLADHATAGGGAGQLWRHQPVATALAAVLALSLAGVIPLGGFWMKEVFLAAALRDGRWGVVAAGVGAATLAVVYAARLLVLGFATGAARGPARTPPVSLLAPVAVLTALTVLVGVRPDLVAEVLVVPAAAAVTGRVIRLPVELHAGLPLMLSALALALGAAAFVARRRWLPAADALWSRVGSLDTPVAAVGSGLLALGGLALRLQHGLLTGYVAVILLGFLGVVAFAVLRAPLPGPAGGAGPFSGTAATAMAGLLAVLAAASVLSFLLRQHLHAVLALGAAGYVIAGIFGLARAPGLGLVQAHVETLVTVLLLLGLAAIASGIRDRVVTPARERVTGGGVALAAAAGAGSAWLSWWAIEHAGPRAVAAWLERHGAAEARDPVAVILLHVRALDTLGEVLVFAAATAGVVVVARLLRGPSG